MKIRVSTDEDKPEIKNIHTAAFGDEEGPVIADLVRDLFEDETARPLLSLVAVDHNRVIGHILFTQVTLSGTSKSPTAQLLAPLAVLPAEQNKGVGGLLIKEGLNQVEKRGEKLVFVLGHPGYYPRYGFTPAGIRGYEAPYRIPEKNSDAWMVKALSPGIIDTMEGKICCSNALNKPEYWRE